LAETAQKERNTDIIVVNLGRFDGREKIKAGINRLIECPDRRNYLTGAAPISRPLLLSID